MDLHLQSILDTIKHIEAKTETRKLTSNDVTAPVSAPVSIPVQGQKVVAFRKQKEYGAKKRIKP